jgi:hypothetical protein
VPPKKKKKQLQSLINYKEVILQVEG